MTALELGTENTTMKRSRTRPRKKERGETGRDRRGGQRDGERRQTPWNLADRQTDGRTAGAASGWHAFGTGSP